MAEKVKDEGKKVKDDTPDKGVPIAEGPKRERKEVKSEKTTKKTKVKSEETVEIKTAEKEVEKTEAVIETKDEEAVVKEEIDKEAIVTEEVDEEAVAKDIKAAEPKRTAGPERKRGAYAEKREQLGPSRPEEFRGEKGRRVYFRRKVCRLCVNKINSVDYKDVDLLRRFVTDRGKIMPRRMTGTCAKHQRIISAAVKRARMVALLPFVTK